MKFNILLITTIAFLLTRTEGFLRTTATPADHVNLLLKSLQDNTAPAGTPMTARALTHSTSTGLVQITVTGTPGFSYNTTGTIFCRSANNGTVTTVTADNSTATFNTTFRGVLHSSCVITGFTSTETAHNVPTTMRFNQTITEDFHTDVQDHVLIHHGTASSRTSTVTEAGKDLSSSSLENSTFTMHGEGSLGEAMFSEKATAQGHSSFVITIPGGKVTTAKSTDTTTKLSKGVVEPLFPSDGRQHMVSVDQMTTTTAADNGMTTTSHMDSTSDSYTIYF